MYALAGPRLLENGLVQCASAAKPDVPSASVARTSGYMCTIYIYIYIYIYTVYITYIIYIYIYIYYVGYIHYTV